MKYQETSGSLRRFARGNITLALMVLALLGSVTVWAEEEKSDDPHAGHKMPAKETSPKHDHEGAEAESRDHESMNHGPTEDPSMDMGSMDMGSMQGGSAPADARDPHAYSGGQDFGPFPLHLGDTQSFASLLLENLEFSQSDGSTSGAYDLQGWYGPMYNRLVLKAEGGVYAGEIEEARTELLWGHAIASHWDTQLGIRYDSGDGPNRNWLAFGLQGLAPYWFEVDATAYLGENGRTALRLDASYELLLTQKLVIQPRVEADIYGKNDPARGLGSGLSEVTAGLRLRYEVRREFAPYVGVEWTNKFGRTKDLARASGEDSSDVSVVAGLRYWF